MCVSLSIFVFSDDILDWKLFSTMYLVIEVILLSLREHGKCQQRRALSLALLELSVRRLYRLLSHTGCYLQSAPQFVHAGVGQDGNAFPFNHSDAARLCSTFSVSLQ